VNQCGSRGYQGKGPAATGRESERLAKLHHYQILDTPPEVAFDRITTLVARLFAGPVALIGFVECDRIWFKSSHGVSTQHTERTPLWEAALQSDDVYTITDTRQLPACLASPWITEELGLRFYAAVPLKTSDGYALGLLCLLDHHPRTLSPEDRATLQDLAAIVIDELERRLASQQSQATNHALTTQFQALVTNMPGMVYRYYPQTSQRPHRFTFVSPQAQDLLEVAPETLLDDADTLIRLLHPEDIDTFQASVAHAVDQCLPWSWQGRIITPSGQLKWIQGRSQAQQTPEGYAWDGLLVDISDRIQAEQNLQAISTALAYAVEGISHLDATGRYLTVNHAYAQMVGYTPEELIGRPWQITVHPDDLAQVVAAYQQMQSQGRVEVEARGRRKDGTIFHKQLVMVAANQVSQQARGHYCFMKDISDRKQAEAVLQREFQRLSAIIAIQQEVAIQSPHLDAVMAVITEQAQRLTHADGAVVELEDGEHLVYRAATGLAQPHMGLRLDIAHSLSGQCLTSGTILQCDDAETDPRVDSAACRRIGLRSMVVVPLVYQASPMGVLKVLSGSPAAFQESDIQTLQIMAGLLAASLHLAAEFEAKNRLLQDLQASESRYRSVIAALSEGVGVVQADGTITACNTSAAKILGMQVDDILGRNLAQLGLQVMAEDGSPRSISDYSIVKTLRTGQPNTNVVSGMVRPDGSTIWISSNTQPLFHAGESHPYAVVVSFTDITDLRHSEIATLKRRAQREHLLSQITQRIRQSLDLDEILNTTVIEVRQFLQVDRVLIYRIFQDGTGSAIAEDTVSACASILGETYSANVFPKECHEAYMHGKVGAIDDVEASDLIPCLVEFSRQLGIKAKLIVPIVQEIHPSEGSNVLSNMSNIGVPSSYLWGLLIAHHCSPHAWQAWEIKLLQQLSLQIAIAIQQSQLYEQVQSANRHLAYLASHDGLTQVANRRRFDTYLQREWGRLARERAPLSLILCDIDYFKPYNDTYGHPAGDVCLVRIAQVLEQVAKRPADLVARYGGEEFAIVLPHTDERGAIQVAETIQATMAQLQIPHPASPMGDYITLSLGIASEVPAPGESVQPLIEQADQALYTAKQQGRNRYITAPRADKLPDNPG